MRTVIPCVNYSDYLAQTLPVWMSLLSSPPVIATTRDDRLTQEATRDFRAELLIVEDNIWHKDEAKFNKAAALDRAFAGSLYGQTCLALDADVFPRGRMPAESEFAHGTLYGCRRYMNDGVTIAPPANMPYIETQIGRADCPQACGGYFQLFRYDSKNTSFGSFPTAATYDYQFAKKFKRARLVESIDVVHLGERRVHWEGRAPLTPIVLSGGRPESPSEPPVETASESTTPEIGQGDTGEVQSASESLVQASEDKGSLLDPTPKSRGRRKRGSKRLGRGLRRDNEEQ